MRAGLALFLMHLISWPIVLIVLCLILVLAPVLYLSIILAWEDQQTRDGRYFALSPRGREIFREQLRRHERLLLPFLKVVKRVRRVPIRRTGFVFNGIAGPRGTCSEEGFADGHSYDPRVEDVFVVTQMRCGTTWMQHLIYQILTRGQGDLVHAGFTLASVSPWLESVRTIPVANAPLIGTERPSRIIKTHFPAPLCPLSPTARYVYVARHPVSCFASCADFLSVNMGLFAPNLTEVEHWFCSEEAMWWGPWPDHVAGWLDLSRTRDNVLFLRFEDMKADLRSVVGRLSRFLGLDPLTDSEVRKVLEKCGFAYMKHHEGTFEMHPPHLLASDASLFSRGTADRHREVVPELAERILDWCRDRSRKNRLPLDGLYWAE